MAKTKTKVQQVDDGPWWEPLPRVADLMLLSEERVRQFVKAGIFDRRDDGMLNVTTCISMYRHFLANPRFFDEW
jgi:hypothetical protein